MFCVVDLAEQTAHIVLLFVVVGQGEREVVAGHLGRTLLHLAMVGGGRRPVGGEVPGERELGGEDGVADLAPWWRWRGGTRERWQLRSWGRHSSHRREVLTHTVAHVLRSCGQGFLPLVSVLGSPVLLQVPPGWEGACAGVAGDLRLVLSVLANTLQQENNQTQRLSTQQRPGRRRGHYKGGS